MRNVLGTLPTRPNKQMLSIIHGYYQVKLGNHYSEIEIDIEVARYGPEYLINLISRLCLKKRMSKKQRQ